MCTCLPYLRSHWGMGLHSALIPTLMHFEGLSSFRLNRRLQLKCRISFSLYSLASWRTWPFSITGEGHFSSAAKIHTRQSSNVHPKSWYHEQKPGSDWSKVNLWLCGLNPSSGHDCSNLARGFATTQGSTERLLDNWQKLSAALKLPTRPSSGRFCQPYRCTLGLFHSTLPPRCSRSHWDHPGCPIWICSWIEERCHNFLLLGHRTPPRFCSQ